MTRSLLNLQRLQVPDHFRILLDTPITTEEAHPRNARNAFLQPSVLVLVCLINKLVRFHIAVEIIRDEVVVALVDDAVAKSSEAARIAELAAFDGVEHFRKVGIELEGAVVVGVAEVFDVFGEIAEEEDVGFTDLARDLNLCCYQPRDSETMIQVNTYICAITGPNDQTSIEHELHVAGTTGLGTRS